MARSLVRHAVLSAIALGGCASSVAPDDLGYEGTGIAVAVSPLTLDTLVDACYSFAVENGATPAQLVVGRGPNAAATFSGQVTGTAARTVCASRFGNGAGGDISYVAPCDADDGVNANTVTLWIDALCKGPVTDAAGTPELLGGAPDAICEEMQDYINPCGTAGCSLPVTCQENADTPVSFNFTIMGQADQGFFDVAVNFEDIFCSAKVDCQYSDGSQLNLLHNSNLPGAPRDQTFVVGRACTAGEGELTRMYSSPTYLACGSDYQLNDTITIFQPFAVFIINPNSLGEGNQGQANVVALVYDDSNSGDWNFADPGDGASLAAFTSNGTGTGNFQSTPVPDFLFQNAVYHGTEALENAAGTDLGKVYWNHAVGVNWEAFNVWADGMIASGLFFPTAVSPFSATRCRIISNLIVTDADGLPPAPALTAGEYTSYPNLYSAVTFWRADGDTAGDLLCTQHPLNGTGLNGGVRAVYNYLHFGFTLGANGALALVPPWGQTPVSFSPYCKMGSGAGTDLLTSCP